jgi:hypothetical protein
MNDNDFAIDDFKLALQYLQGQFGRLWERFNFFLTVETALFGFLGWLVFDKGNVRAVAPTCLLGMSISLLWYVVGAQDRHLVEVYRHRAGLAAKAIATTSNAKDYAAIYIGLEAPSKWTSINSWYWRPLSITHLPVWIAICLTLTWFALFLKGAALLAPFAPMAH